MCCYRCQLFYIQHWQPFYLFSIFTTFRVTFFVKWFVFKNNQCSKRVYYMTNNSKNIQLLMNLLTEFAKDGYNSDGALKFHHIYIYWTREITYSFQVGIYLWPPPFLFTTLMYVIFKRTKLIVINQKFILSIMMLNMCYLLSSAVWDTV